MYQITDEVKSMLAESFKKYAVSDCSSLEEFVLRYLKPEYYRGKLAEVLSKRTISLDRYGYTIIPNPESTTNDIVVYYKQ